MLATATIALLALVSLGNTTSMNNTIVVVLPKEATTAVVGIGSHPFYFLKLCLQWQNFVGIMPLTATVTLVAVASLGHASTNRIINICGCTALGCHCRL
jgi:hypothetical protein